MKTKKLSYLFVFLTAFSVFAGVFTVNISAREKSLVFAGDENFAPYSFASSGVPSGYSVDIVKILSAVINKNIVIKLMSWEKCLAELKNGKIDGLIGAPVYKGWENFADFSSSVLEIEFAIFVESGNSYVNSLKSLEGTVTAVPRKSLIINELEKYNRIKLLETASVLEALNKLKNREVKAVIAEKAVALYYIQQENIENIKIAGNPVEPVYKYAVATKKNAAELLNEINRGITVLEENNTLKNLKRKWFGLQLLGPFPWKMVILMTSGITLLMLVLSGILWAISLNATVKAKTKQIQIMSRDMVEKDKLAVLGKLAGQIAHELRTPLSVINNSVFLLRKEGSRNREQFKKRLNTLENKVKLTSNILESILSYSRVKAEVATIVSVKECIEEALKDLELPEGIQKNVSFSEEKYLQVFIDFHQLYSVLRNLFLNAIQAMHDSGGEINIEASPTRNHMATTIRVHDTGPGIMQNIQGKVFNLFYSTKMTGTGLGLPISKSIIEANGGHLILEKSNDEGSCFVIELPSSKQLAKGLNK